MHNSVMELRNICNHPYLSQLHVEEACSFPVHFKFLTLMKDNGSEKLIIFNYNLVNSRLFLCISLVPY